MNTYIANNFSKLKLFLFFKPVFLLITIVLFLYSQKALYVDKYIQIQKNCFFYINNRLGQYSALQLNLSQSGDALILLSFLSIFIIYAPKIWEALLSGLLICLIFSALLKKIFEVPRPAAVFDHHKFIIIGKALYGHNSLPSGHSITIFTIFTVLLFAFIPQKIKYRTIYFFFVIALGLILAFARVAVGAHYPFDVIIGSIIGYIFGLSGIFLNQKYKLWTWINSRTYWPIFITLFIICIIVLIKKIIDENLTIFYLSLLSLLISLYITTYIYVKK